MQTRVLHVAAQGDDAVESAAQLLLEGGLVAFPTETVYGLGALGLNATAVGRLFEAKGRPHSDPLILHVAYPEWVRFLANQFTPDSERLMAAFWPGPLTLVLPRAPGVPGLVTAGLDSVAVRMPAHPVALQLLRRVGEPLAGPSANLFGRTSPTRAEHVLQDLEGRIEAVLDAGPTEVGVESTVVDVRGETPVLLRPGGVPRSELERVVGRPVLLHRAGREAEEGMRSPGLLTRHYSPRAAIRLYDGEDAAVIPAVRAWVTAHAAPAATALLCFTEDLPHLSGLPARVVELGSRERLEEVARRLYATFRQLDAEGLSVLVVRTAPPGGLGDALNDRLLRAASGNVVRESSR